MTDTQSSYRQIIKTTSIFGGVQLFNILISLVRSKIVAILIGPAGIGIIGLYQSALNLISSFSNAGLETSGIKAIAAAEGDPQLLARESSILKRLIWITGVLGTLAVVVLSPFLSKVSFGSDDFSLAFILISFTLLFKQLTNGGLIVLQGLGKIQYLAKANLYGNFCGLLISLPLYFFFKRDGIVPSIVISSIVAMLVALYFRAKIRINTVKLSNKEVMAEGKQLILLGFSLSLVGLLTTLSAYLLQVFISNYRSVEQVGFYSAGFTILNTYVGIIFTAMATDYYPRLVKAVHDQKAMVKLVSEQSAVGILLLTPVVVLFLVFAPTVIRLLYSKEFLPIVPLVCWGILGMIVKAVSWSMGYILIAKGDSGMFIRTSIFFNSLFLAINIFGFYFYGLEGLGITFLLNYIIHFLGLKMITARRYRFAFDSQFYLMFFYCMAICVTTFLCLDIESVILKYILLAVLIVISFWFSIRQLDKKLNFRDFFRKN